MRFFTFKIDKRKFGRCLFQQAIYQKLQVVHSNCTRHGVEDLKQWGNNGGNVEIYSITGVPVLKQVLAGGTNSVNMNDLSSGVFFYKVM